MPESNTLELAIKGVKVKKLITHPDDRGFFREIIRISDSFFDEFAQWSHSRMYAGVAKAWHFHRFQTDWWYVANGVLKVALHDLRNDSPTRGKTIDFLMGDNQESQVVAIPPMVAHGCKCLAGPSDLFYITSKTYNPDDEGRLPHDDPQIGYDWLAQPPIK